MPELPEVETILQGLRASLPGRRIVEVDIFHDDPLRPSAAAVREGLVGRTFIAGRRFGKHLFLDLDGGLTLAAHLRMTGQLRVQDPAAPLLPHTHAVFRLDDARELRWRDVRRFGWLHLVPTAEVAELPSVRRLGPDALAIDEAAFVVRVRSVRRMMKPLLLAQDVVCGLGNIYADEVLWRARIHPRQRSDRLGSRRARRLYLAVQGVLSEAIEARGSSIDGEYVGVDGESGAYQNRHAVYGREGLPAPCCGRPVRRAVLASRSTFYCPHCQRRR